MSRRCETCITVADRMDGDLRELAATSRRRAGLTSPWVSKPNDRVSALVTIDVDSAPTEYVEKAGGAIQTFRRAVILHS